MQLDIMPPIDNVTTNGFTLFLPKIVFVQYFDKKRKWNPVTISNVHNERYAVFLTPNSAKYPLIIPHGFKVWVPKGPSDAVFGIYCNKNINS